MKEGLQVGQAAVVSSGEASCPGIGLSRAKGTPLRSSPTFSTSSNVQNIGPPLLHPLDNKNIFLWL